MPRCETEAAPIQSIAHTHQVAETDGAVGFSVTHGPRRHSTGHVVCYSTMGPGTAEGDHTASDGIRVVLVRSLTALTSREDTTYSTYQRTLRTRSSRPRPPTIVLNSLRWCAHHWPPRPRLGCRLGRGGPRDAISDVTGHSTAGSSLWLTAVAVVGASTICRETARSTRKELTGRPPSPVVRHWDKTANCSSPLVSMPPQCHGTDIGTEGTGSEQCWHRHWHGRHWQ